MSLGDVISIRREALEASKESIEGDTGRAPSVGPDRYEELRNLDCFEMVMSRLLHGHSPADIARFIIYEAKEFDKLTRISTEASLCDLLYDFRKTIKTSELIEKTIPEAVREAKEKLAKGVNELEELNYLYLLQKDRIEIDYSTERKIRKLFKTTGNEIAIAMGILKIMSGIKQDLGLMKRSLGTMEIDHTLRAELPYKSKAIEEVIRDPVSRAKVIGIMHRLLSRKDIAGEIVDDMRGIEDVREAVVVESKKAE
ncbi:MAG: hypothetical protein HQK96_05620 [Nitrospirae bacterium]|nr:hypothetical protein [Nitrospirota bacterium]